MAVGEIITAARYNAMQAKVATVLGNGSDQFGYGQNLTSSSISPTNTVNAAHMAVLKTDMVNAFVHQTGSLPALTNIVSTNDITDLVYSEYESISNTIYNNKNNIFETTQASVESKLVSTRSTEWGGSSQPQTIAHEFTVTFSNVDHRRHFFNAGGEIRFSASLTGSSGQKFVSWNSMLSALGTVKFNYTETTAPSGTPSNIGNFDLTSTYQTIFIKSGSGTYSDSDYIIKAKGVPTSNIITFLIELSDGESNSVDEPVTGTLTSTISQLRPTGSYVEVPTPIYQTIRNLA